MRIALIFPELYPDITGGGGIVAHDLAQQLAKRHAVTVISSRLNVHKVTADNNLPYKVIRVLEYPTPRRWPFMLSTMPPRLEELRRLYEVTRGFDVANAHGYGFPLIDIATNFLSHRKTPIVRTYHGFPVTPRKRGGVVRLLFEMYRTAFGNPGVRRAAAHTAVSVSVAERFGREFKIEAEVIPNGVRELPTDETIEESFEEVTRKAKSIILCVGRLEWIKAFDVVIRALALLPEKYLLYIAGRDNGAERVLRMLADSNGVSERVVFLGMMEPKSLACLYRTASVCVVSSKTESFSLVALEAMSMGCPLVSTPVGAVSEVGVHGENALLFDHDDFEQLARHIRGLDEDVQLRDRLVKGGLQTARYFAWNSVVRRYEDVYCRVIEGKGDTLRLRPTERDPGLQ